LHALVFVAVAVWCFTTALVGGLVGLVLGNIRLPVIVFAASSPGAGAGANIGISGLAAATAGLAHVRAGRVDWRLVRWMAPVSVLGAVGGSAVGAVLPGHVLLIGFLGGVVGLILGSLRMPALLRFVGADATRAVGTNLLVGVCVGIAGIAAHAPSGVDWTLFAIGSAASVPGALLGARLTGRLDERRLLQAVGAILLVAGTAAILQGVF
jgi:uncharacterized protein